MDSLISTVAKYTCGFIGGQLGYLWDYNNNIKNLDDEVDMLKETQQLVQNKVTVAKRNGEEILDFVNKWLSEVDDIIKSYDMMIDVFCLNLVQRHQVSRKAKQMAGDVSRIKAKWNNSEIVSHKVPPSKVKREVSDFMSFGSRESIIKQIMDALMDNNVNRIGVYGMGGVGKTMLVQEISREVIENRLFDEVVMSAVSQTQDIERIQQELGEMLGLEFEQKTLPARAIKLYQRLKNTKKILIVLDDIWKDIDLNQIGVPSEDHEGCKILYISRDKNTLSGMYADTTFEVKVLEQEESWNLFNKMAGEIVEQSDLKPTALDIVKECAHLPIAIATIARALKSKPLPIWRDALNQLKNPKVMNIKGMNDKVYTSLELSYEHLDSREAKSVFLLCSMFPEDHRISVEDLHVYTMGMGLLMDIDTLAEGRDRTIKLVDDLVSSSLLHEYQNGYVKMHDIVRDVAILIASKDDQIRTLSYVQGLNKWQEEKISGAHTAAYLHFENSPNPPQKLMLPNIQLLMLTGPYDNKHELSTTFFEEMKELKALELERMRISLSPPSLHSFANLRSLRLLNCELKDVDMSSVELNKLEVLSFRGSTITEIPMIISQSIHLKVLDLSSCNELKVIPPDLLSKLTKLEELFLGSFNGWEESLNRERRNASLCELKHLSRLSALSIHIPNEKIMPKQLISSGLNLEKFNISIGCVYYFPLYYQNMFKKLSLRMESESLLDDWIKKLLKRAEDLDLGGYIAEKFLHFEYKFDEIHFSHLKNLHLGHMKEVNHVIRESKKAFFKIFTNLERIEIINCMMLEVVFVSDIEEATNKLELIRLKSLTLRGLPGLISFCSKIEQLNNSKKVGTLFNNQVSLPNLETLEIEDVKNLKMIRHKLLIPDSSFTKLIRLNIVGCDNLEIVLTSNMMSILKCLENLTILSCNSLEGIFEVEEPNATEQCDGLLPRLRYLFLHRLPNLKYVWREDPQELQIFENVYFSITECPKFKRVYPVKVVQQLKELEIGYGELKETLEKVAKSVKKVETQSHKGELWEGEELLPKLLSLKLWGSLNYKWTHFPIQMVRIFLNLRDLEVREIFVDEIFSNWPNAKSHPLKKLTLLKLPKLKNLLKESSEMNTSLMLQNLEYLRVEECGRSNSLLSSSVLSLRSLRELIIHKCHGLTHLLHPQVAAALVQIQHMELMDLPNLKYVWSEDPQELQIFKNMKRLYIHQCPKFIRVYPQQLISLTIEYGGLIEALKSVKMAELDPCDSSKKTEMIEIRDGPDLLPKLEDLKLSGSILNYKWTHFSKKIVPILHTLKVLELRELFVEEIFPICPNAQSHPLERLELYKLPKLKHLWKENSQMNTLMLPNLEYLKIKECGRLNSIVPSSVSSLRNLRSLNIHKCYGLTDLINPHMATTLVQLRYMKLSECKMMTTVIAQGSGVEEEIVFPELVTLKIVDLPILTSFHSGKYIFRFPCLESVEIKKCPEMKVFSMGVTSAPCLEKSDLWWSDIEEEDPKDIMVEDINVIIRHAWENIYDSSFQHLFTEHASLPDLDYTPRYTPSGFKLRKSW